MGQYYAAVILGEKQPDGVKEIIRTWVNPHNFENGAKLMEHSYVGNNFVSFVEALISDKGMFYKSRIVWAGDYADDESETGETLSSRLSQDNHYDGKNPSFDTSYRYIVNHTKEEYVDKRGLTLHPLPLLTAEGNGRGGGDYDGPNKDMVGYWARDVISVVKEPPGSYAHLIHDFDLDA
jgi:hypothetical protein